MEACPSHLIALLEDGNGLVAVGLAVVALYFLMSGLRRRYRQQNPFRQMGDEESPQRQPQKPTGSLDKQEKMRRDLEDLIVELQELSRKIGAEIDTRFAKLEAGIRDADRRIATLNRLKREMAAGEGGAASGAQIDGSDDRYRVVYELSDAGHSPVEIAQELGKTPGEIELILNLRKSVQRQE